MSQKPIECFERIWDATALAKWQGGAYGRWTVQSDMNCDGAVTISDVWLWVKYVFYAPGDFMLMELAPTELGVFFELKEVTLGGGLSLALSIVSWLIILSCVARISDAA